MRSPIRYRGTPTGWHLRRGEAAESLSSLAVGDDEHAAQVGLEDRFGEYKGRAGVDVLFLIRLERVRSDADDQL